MTTCSLEPPGVRELSSWIDVRSIDRTTVAHVPHHSPVSASAAQLQVDYECGVSLTCVPAELRSSIRWQGFDRTPAIWKLWSVARPHSWQGFDPTPAISQILERRTSDTGAVILT